MDNNNYNPYAGMPQNNGNGQNTNGQNVNQQTGYQNVGSSGTNQANAYGTYYGSGSAGNTGSTYNTGSAGNTGSSYSTGNTANAGNAYNTGNTADAGSAYNTGNAGNTANGTASAYNTYNTANGTYNAYSNGNAAPNAGQEKPNRKQRRERKKRERRERNHSGFGATMGKAVAVALVFGLVGGGVFTGVSYAGTKALGISNTSTVASSESSSSTDSTNVKQTSTGNASDLTDVASIADEVMPSIVAITNKAVVTYQSFWGQSMSQESESCGSGIIIGQDSQYLYIATNNHVVASSEALTVQFSNDTVVDAEIRGTDAADDLAVVQVKLSDIDDETLSAIKTATIGTSDSYQVGSAAIAIGNALGYGQSVTTGVISALDRSVSTTDETTGQTITNNNLIQTDAAINPGNSGGALLNANGEVIGINSVKYASTEVEGIGYAIPMDYAMPIIKELIDTGSYVDTQSAYLGIKGGDVTSEMIAYNYPEGVYVASVVDGSGAAKAGIQQGDVITAIDGNTVTSMNELQSALDSYSAGDTVTITVSRQQGQGFQESDVSVTLSSASDMQ